MSRVLLLFCAALVLSSCGVRRPLVKPKDIPAYEEAERRRIEKLQRQKAEVEALPESPKPATAPAP
ncbi:MAG: hypothetical protein ACKVOE_03635 [Rickettsiales bacterium]